MTTSAAEVACFRSAVLDRWRAEGRKLQGAEAVLHKSLHPDVEIIVGGKSLLLLRAMLRRAGLPSADALLQLLCTGFPLAGQFPESGVFPLSGLRHMKFKTSGGTPKRSDGRCWPRAVGRVTQSWMRSSIASRRRKWRRADCAGRWTVMPSQSLDGGSQAGALRLCRVSRPGRSTTALSQRSTPPSACMKVSIQPTSTTLRPIVGRALTRWSRGSQHRSPSSPFANLQRHSDLAGASLVGRLWDIANAYRHLPLWASQHELAVVAVWNPATHGVDLFQQLCMPFGTSASVVSRNWVAFGFNLLLTQLFRVGSTNFDDDFTVGEASCLAESASKVADGMFDSLGWPLKPLPGFAEEPAPLGAVLDLREAICGEIIAKNRPERVAELVTDITEFTESPGSLVDEAPQASRAHLVSHDLCASAVAQPVH